MVTPGWEFEVPTCTTTGTAAPAGVPEGICAVTWSTPATPPGAPPAKARPAGAAPAKFTVAVCPPIVTFTVPTGTGSDEGSLNVPSVPDGLVWPAPVI